MKSFAIACAGALSLLCSAPASAAYTLGVQYFSVTPGGDFNTQCCSTVSNYVLSNLGPDGLPVYNPAHSGGPNLTDLNGINELTWWSPSMNSRVTATGSGTVTLPFSDNTFFVPNGTGTNNANSFLTAIFSGVMTLPVAETVNFTFSADDDMFLFVDGQSVGQVGGVHPVTGANVTTSLLSAGSHTFTAFYADRNVVAAEANLNITTEGLTVTPPVPEPATWAMMLLGFCGIGIAMRRRKSRSGLLQTA